ncbi:MAG UNVERIFIED_CONTAM: sigma 54-interacting transcriptional regulator [Planctomycetaceae bacterium]
MRTAPTAAEAIRTAQERDFDVGICDIQLPDGDGVRVLRQLHRINPAMFVMIISAYATVENAVEAFTAGAFDYLVKPVRFEELVKRMQRLFKFQDLFRENQRLRKDLARSAGFDQVVGSSTIVQDLLKTIRKVAATNSNVLLVGETGTGKELFAREIHLAGPNRDDQFMAINCGTRPVELLEAQLFGTGDGQDGALVAAGSGTVFLDEVSMLPGGPSQKSSGQSSIPRSLRREDHAPSRCRLESSPPPPKSSARKFQMGTSRKICFIALTV